MVNTLPSNAGSVGLIPNQGPKILHASQPKTQHIKQNQFYNKFNKDFKNDPHQKNLKKKIILYQSIYIYINLYILEC